MPLEDAFEFVKTQRQKTEPNEGFIEQLKLFQSASYRFEQENEANTPLTNGPALTKKTYALRAIHSMDDMKNGAPSMSLKPKEIV